MRAARLRGELGCIQVATILAIAEGSSDPTATASAGGGGVVAPPPLDLGALSGAAAGGPDSEKLPQLSAGRFAANRDRLSVERGTHPGYRHRSRPCSLALWLPGPLAPWLPSSLPLASFATAGPDSTCISSVGSIMEDEMPSSLNLSSSPSIESSPSTSSAHS